jgi:hypothetical protein
MACATTAFSADAEIALVEGFANVFAGLPDVLDEGFAFRSADHRRDLVGRCPFTATSEVGSTRQQDRPSRIISPFAARAPSGGATWLSPAAGYGHT